MAQVLVKPTVVGDSEDNIVFPADSILMSDKATNVETKITAVQNSVPNATTTVERTVKFQRVTSSGTVELFEMDITDALFGLIADGNSMKF